MNRTTKRALLSLSFLTLGAAAWADVGNLQSLFAPRHQYLLDSPKPTPPLQVVEQPQPQILLAENQNITVHSDAYNPIIPRTPIVLLQERPTLLTPPAPPEPTNEIREEPKKDRNRAVVTANIWVQHHELEVGLKLTGCDQAIDREYGSNPPAQLECVSSDEGTRYVTRNYQTARDGAYIWNYK